MYVGSPSTRWSAWAMPAGWNASVAMLRCLQLGVRVTKGRQVGRPRLRVQVFQQGVMQRRVLTLFDLAGAVVDGAEDDGLRRAGRLAGGQDFAVADAPAFLLGVNHGLPNPLHAVGTLLHDAARPDGYVRVVLLPEALGGVIGVVEEVEAPDLVRAVVRAEARADA